MNFARIATLSAVAVLGVSGLSACGSTSDSAGAGAGSGSSGDSASSAPASSSAQPSSASPSSSAPAAAAVLTIKDYKYSGASSVAPGTQVTVKNEDSEAHTVTADSGGAFDVKIDPGKSASFTAPAKAGSFPYHCTYHGNMHGTLKVG